MLVNVVTSTFPADQADAVAAMLAGFEAWRSNDDPRIFVLFETWADAAAGANGIRPLAQSRVAHKCTPLIG
jgi:quinol monooxygenase YgiN